MYQVLYRKWRPKTFEEVIENRLTHAYLFTGSRGTGKTTCAKILAKAANCLNPQNGSPCGACEICKGIENGSVLDVVEMDAASNRKIENIRDIIDEVQFKPNRARFRVYIVDEVPRFSKRSRSRRSTSFLSSRPPRYTSCRRRFCRAVSGLIFTVSRRRRSPTACSMSPVRRRCSSARRRRC